MALRQHSQNPQGGQRVSIACIQIYGDDIPLLKPLTKTSPTWEHLRIDRECAQMQLPTLAYSIQEELIPCEQPNFS